MSLLADEAMYFGAVADGVESQQEEIAELRQQLAEAQAEVLEQARIVGMSGEREIALRQQVGLLRTSLLSSANYVDTLGGNSFDYRRTLAATELITNRRRNADDLSPYILFDATREN